MYLTNATRLFLLINTLSRKFLSSQIPKYLCWHHRVLDYGTMHHMALWYVTSECDVSLTRYIYDQAVGLLTLTTHTLVEDFYFWANKKDLLTGRCDTMRLPSERGWSLMEAIIAIGFEAMSLISCAIIMPPIVLVILSLVKRKWGSKGRYVGSMPPFVLHEKSKRLFGSPLALDPSWGNYSFQNDYITISRLCKWFILPVNFMFFDFRIFMCWKIPR